MLIVAGDPDCQSAGSFFKNPVLSEAQHADLRDGPMRRDSIPSYPALEKTRRSRRPGWSRNRDSPADTAWARRNLQEARLAIVNRGEATAAEVLALKDQIQHRVEDIWGVRWNRNR